MLLTGVFCLISYTHQSPASIGSTHRGLSPPTSTINEKSALTDIAIVQSDGGIFSTEDSSSQMDLAYVKLTNKQKKLTSTGNNSRHACMVK